MKRTHLALVSLVFAASLVSGCANPATRVVGSSSGDGRLASETTTVPAFTAIVGGSELRQPFGSGAHYGDPKYLAQYQALADAAGLKLRFRSMNQDGRMVSGDSTDPTVQIPQPGTVVARGSEVTLTVVATDMATEAPAGSSAPAASVARPSEKALAYAKRIGGVSHDGETLYFIIAASTESESAAQKQLDQAIPRFGDMQSYFIVQRSDNFKGMKPGWFVVIEAYPSESEAKVELDFARRGFGKNSPYIKRAFVMTTDPIPVNHVDVNPTGN